MDGLSEEVVGNMLEFAGPLIDSFLKEIGKSMILKLSHSKVTGLMNPTTLFIPWPVFRLMLVLVRVYEGEVHQNFSGSKFIVTVKTLKTISKLFSPSRFAGECYYAYRHFKKVPAKVGSKKQILFVMADLLFLSQILLHSVWTTTYSNKAQLFPSMFNVIRLMILP